MEPDELSFGSSFFIKKSYEIYLSIKRVVCFFKDSGQKGDSTGWDELEIRHLMEASRFSLKQSFSFLSKGLV